MPDIISHAVVGYIFLRPKWKKYLIPSIFIFGCVYPDIWRGPALMIGKLFDLGLSGLLPLILLHSPVMLGIQAWLISQFFTQDIRKKVFFNLLAGITLHLIMDGFQKAYHFSYFWLFPFSFKNPVRGLWWADEGFWLTLEILMVGGVVFILRKYSESQE